MSDGFALLILLIGAVALAIATLRNRNHYEEELILSPGHYRVGVDIPVGKCNLLATSGGGNFIVQNHATKTWSVGNSIGTSSGLQAKQFRNLILHKGDKLEINGNVSVLLTPPTVIENPTEEPLVPGIYRFGVDVPPGKYDLEIVSGDGDVLLVEVNKDEYVFYQDMSLENPFKAHSFNNIICTRDYELWINGNLQIKLKRSPKQPRILTKAS